MRFIVWLLKSFPMCEKQLKATSSNKTNRLRFQNQVDEFSMPRSTRLLTSQTGLDGPQTQFCFLPCRVEMVSETIFINQTNNQSMPFN